MNNPSGEFKEENVSLYHEDESDDTGLIDWGSMNITVLDHVRLRELAKVCVGDTKWDGCVGDTKGDGCVGHTKGDGCVGDTKWDGSSACLSDSKIADTWCHSNEPVCEARLN